MTIKVYISGICGSQEVRKHQQRVLFILQSLPIDLYIIDVTEPGKDEELIYMQETAKKHNKETQLPPQIFNDDVYCGDYADFELANDDDDIMKFLKLESGPLKAEILKSGGTISDTVTQNGISNHETDQEMNDSNIIVNSEDTADEKSAIINETPAAVDETTPVAEEIQNEVPENKEIVSSEPEESEEESEG